jgi:uncharacterized repeat protein (TIGR03803 family)
MRSKNVSLGLAVVLAVFAIATLMNATPAMAQTEKVLSNFLSNSSLPFWPSSGVIFDKSGNLYGVTSNGGSNGVGTVYELSPTGSGSWTQKVLHSFGQGTDGQTPVGNLIMDSAGNLYGTTVYGGTGTCATTPVGCGTVYELVPGVGGVWTEKRLHSFKGTDGNYPGSGVIMDASGNLYGTTPDGGAFGSTYTGGTVFELKFKGGTWGESVLHSFGSTGDGQAPAAGLVLDASGNLYGTTGFGGTVGTGIVFELVHGSSGWTENVLYSFTDGGDPSGNLIFDGSGNIYGTTAFGGPTGAGSAFELTPAGGGVYTESTLFSFAENGFDGAEVHGGVVLDASGNLYGTAEFGGIGRSGVVFELTPAGGTWNEIVLRNFSEIEKGYLPQWNLIFDSAGNLYGTTIYGGVKGGGTVFELTP